MRVLMLTAFLAMPSLVWGQSPETPDQSKVGQYLRFSADVSIAFACKLRDKNWMIDRTVLITGFVMNYARQHAETVGGGAGDIGAKQFVYGAGFQSADDAVAEFQRYGSVACQKLQESGRLLLLDQLLTK